jgi:FkbM family methyltransferase
LLTMTTATHDITISNSKCLVSKLVSTMKSVDRKLWPAHRVKLSPEMAACLQKRKLIVADVGSAGGPEEIWLGLKEFIHFLTFEPNPRSDESSEDPGITNFTVGLWSSRGKMELQITGHPDSSSLMHLNPARFEDYLSNGGMETAGTATINVDKLDNLLAGKPDLSPDFLKIDVESGEMEVLKGSAGAVATSVLGLKLETSFVELRFGAPLLWDIDVHLTNRGFVLFNLGRNYWIRKNGLHGYSSQPQLIWGDAIYFLSRDHFLKRLGSMEQEQKKSLLARFVLMLLCYGVHDYTWEIIEATQASGHVSAEFAADLKRCVTKSMDTTAWYFFKMGFGLLFALAIFSVSFPFSEPRKRSIYYIKQRSGRLFYNLWRRASLAGRVHNSVLEDSYF